MKTSVFAQLSRRNGHLQAVHKSLRAVVVQPYRVVDAFTDTGAREVSVTLYSTKKSVTARCLDPTIAAQRGQVVLAAIEGREHPRITAWHSADATRAPQWLHTPNPAWLLDEQLYREFVGMVDDLRPALREAVHQVLAADDDLSRFVSTGASICDHHAAEGGLLEHTLDCMRLVRATARELGEGVDVDLAIAGAALHDVGKCREYVRKGSFTQLSDQGELSGHKLTGHRMVAVALARSSMGAEEQEALLHCISAVPGAPDYLGLRQPRMVEAHLVSMCDGLSAKTAPMLAVSRGQKGWSQLLYGKRRRVYSSKSRASA